MSRCRVLRLWLSSLPFVGYCFRFAVLADGQPVDLAWSRKAALRRRPRGGCQWSTVIPIREAD